MTITPVSFSNAPQDSASSTSAAAPRCPIDHSAQTAPSAPPRQKTARVVEPVNRPVECDDAGVWHVRGFAETRAILRSGSTKQAGFRAEVIGQIPGQTNQPILYQEGKAHQEQRKQTARFFTPRVVGDNYRAVMETLADQLIAGLRRSHRADLSRLSMTLAVRVAAEVVGLTNSRLPGMDRRLNAFFTESSPPAGRGLRVFASTLRAQARVLQFYWLDVRPAIAARRRQPREDVISHLLARTYSDLDILTECVTYGAAGMVTTREFISAAAWHLLERPELRARYLAAPEDERRQMLEEILRLEPVVGHLFRRATADMVLESQGTSVTIPAGALLDLHLYAANGDALAAGEHPLDLCPGREILAERAAPSLMSFGDGHHRCPGSYVALQETDIFLQRLLALEGLRIEHAPALSWNDLVTGYELRDFIIVLD